LAAKKPAIGLYVPGGKSMRGSYFKRLLRDTRGATAIEYGLIVALIVIAIVGALQSVGNENGGMWSWVDRDVLGAFESTR
jgi:pilus assembly protein Flp/PilA